MWIALKDEFQFKIKDGSFLVSVGKLSKGFPEESLPWRGSKTFASLLNKLIIHLLIKAQIENESGRLNSVQ